MEENLFKEEDFVVSPEDLVPENVFELIETNEKNNNIIINTNIEP